MLNIFENSLQQVSSWKKKKKKSRRQGAEMTNNSKNFTVKKCNVKETGGINFQTGVLQFPEYVCKGDWRIQLFISEKLYLVYNNFTVYCKWELLSAYPITPHSSLIPCDLSWRQVSWGGKEYLITWGQQWSIPAVCIWGLLGQNYFNFRKHESKANDRTN